MKKLTIILSILTLISLQVYSQGHAVEIKKLIKNGKLELRDSTSLEDGRRLIKAIISQPQEDSLSAVTQIKRSSILSFIYYEELIRHKTGEIHEKMSYMRIFMKLNDSNDESRKELLKMTNAVLVLVDEVFATFRTFFKNEFVDRAYFQRANVGITKLKEVQVNLIKTREALLENP